MVYNTTQHPPPHSHTLFVYTADLLWEGGRGQREGKGATVHKREPSSMGTIVQNTIYAVVIASLYSEEMKNKLFYSSWVENTYHE